MGVVFNNSRVITSGRLLTPSVGSTTPGVVTSGLVFYLDAGNASSYPGTGTSWFDLSGLGNTFTLQNSPTYGATGGGSFLFNGSNNSAIIAAGTNASYTSATFIVIVEAVGTFLTSTGLIFSPGTGGASIAGTTQGSTGNIKFNWNDDPTSYNNASGLTIPGGTTGWAYVAVSVSPTLTTYCVNNTFTTFVYTPTTITLGSGLTVGNDSRFASRLFNGYVAVAMMYNTALSQTDLTQNYNYYKTRFGI